MTKVIKVPESRPEVISPPQSESQPTALNQPKYAEPTELSELVKQVLVVDLPVADYLVEIYSG